MFCAACGEQTSTAPCAGCGVDPRLRGTWALEATIGRGATATTWRALGPDGPVAVKEVPLHRARTPKARELVHREAQVLRQLSHPCIPRLIDAFEDGAGKRRTLWLVQDLVDGEPLSLAAPWPEGRVFSALHRVLDILEYLHGLSPPVVHRDIKPNNVLAARDGRLVLVDFGAVRDVLADPRLGGSTVAGTFGYMAPEQLRGDAWPSSDLYGLGALAVALLTGREPSELMGVVPVPRWWEAANPAPRMVQALDRMLDPDPMRRVQTVEEVRWLLGGPMPPGGPNDTGGRPRWVVLPGPVAPPPLELPSDGAPPSPVDGAPPSPVDGAAPSPVDGAPRSEGASRWRWPVSWPAEPRSALAQRPPPDFDTPPELPVLHDPALPALLDRVGDLRARRQPEEAPQAEQPPRLGKAGVLALLAPVLAAAGLATLAAWLAPAPSPGAARSASASLPLPGGPLGTVTPSGPGAPSFEVIEVPPPPARPPPRVLPVVRPEPLPPGAPLSAHLARLSAGELLPAVSGVATRALVWAPFGAERPELRLVGGRGLSAPTRPPPEQPFPWRLAAAKDELSRDPSLQTCFEGEGASRFAATFVIDLGAGDGIRFRPSPTSDPVSWCLAAIAAQRGLAVEAIEHDVALEVTVERRPPAP